MRILLTPGDGLVILDDVSVRCTDTQGQPGFWEQSCDGADMLHNSACLYKTPFFPFALQLWSISKDLN